MGKVKPGAFRNLGKEISRLKVEDRITVFIQIKVFLREENVIEAFFRNITVIQTFRVVLYHIPDHLTDDAVCFFRLTVLQPFIIFIGRKDSQHLRQGIGLTGTSFRP